MNGEEFIIELKKHIDNDSRSFIENMAHCGMRSGTFCDWMIGFIAWMEWASEEECIDCYGEEDETR